ncbi:MAG: hypothetical protein AAF289_12175 [Cyanobacteria bacterium P01_A01_bin.135]
MTYNNTARSSADQTIALSLVVAFTTFVVGYTAARASLLTQGNADTAATADANAEVVPHQSELWEGFSAN